MGCRYRFGEFEWDAAACELWRGDRLVALPRQSAVLLQLLIDRRGHVVRREEVRQALWPDGTHVDYEHGLNNATARLRRALGDASVAPRFVETLPRVGYRLVAPVATADPVDICTSRPGGADRRTWWAAAAGVVAAVFGAGVLAGANWSSSSARPAAAAVVVEAREQAARSLAYTRLVLSGDLAARTARAPAEEAAARALALAPTEADALVAAGYVAMWGQWDWEAADRLFRSALATDPGSWRAHQASALWLAAQARHDEAQAVIETARALHPASTDLATDVAHLAFLAGRDDVAIETLRQVLADQPDDARAHELLSRALERRGDRPAAADHFGRYLVLIGIDQHFAEGDARVVAVQGFVGLTRWHLSRPSNKAVDTYGLPFKMALSHAVAGDRHVALDWLERARDQRDSRLLFVNVEPRFLSLRDDPRFRQLLEAVGL